LISHLKLQNDHKQKIIYFAIVNLIAKKSEVKLVSVRSASALTKLKGVANLIEMHAASYVEIPIVI
jgi:hypothetical protein